jgi:hypothetical protein
MSYKSSIHIMCATAYQWRDLTSVTCWAGISDLIPIGDVRSCGWVLRRMAGLMPLVVRGFITGMTVALPCGNLYSFTGLLLGVVLPGCLNMYDRRYGCLREIRIASE